MDIDTLISKLPESYTVVDRDLIVRAAAPAGTSLRASRHERTARAHAAGAAGAPSRVNSSSMLSPGSTCSVDSPSCA